MKRLILASALLLALLFSSCSLAQTITMDSVHASFEYPDSWLVVSPQLASVYAPLLEDASIDAKALSQDMEAQGILSRAYNADFTQSLSILALEDDAAFDIYDIASITDDQRKTIRRRAENGSLLKRPVCAFRISNGRRKTDCTGFTSTTQKRTANRRPAAASATSAFSTAAS